MNQSFLIFGREPSLSLAELYRWLDSNTQKIVLAARTGAIVADEALGKDAPKHLAGVIKAGQVIKTVAKLEAKDLADILQFFIKSDGKFHFGLSGYGVRLSSRLGLEVKKILKETGASVRLAESRHDNLSSADVVKNKLLEKGVELCVIKTDDKFYIGRTLSVQPFADYSERDYGRPGRDAKSGMLPPKLALAMINMAARQNKNMTILDPFCGSGTVLQEALLLGHKVIGTDIDEQAIKNSKMNLEWLVETQPVASLDNTWRVEQADVRQINKKLSAQSMDAIVTEFDLGPPLLGGEPINKIKSVVASLSDFYVDALRALRPILKDSGRAVVAWPYWREHKLFITAFDELQSLGWELMAPYPKEYQNILPLSGRGTLLYGRPNQHVGREILILKKLTS